MKKTETYKIDIAILDKIFTDENKKELEKCFAIWLYVSQIDKNKILRIGDKAKIMKVCSDLEISERSYYRYVQMLKHYGFCVAENDFLRFSNITTISKNLGFKITPFVVIIELRSFSLEWLISCIRFLRLKQCEHKKQRVIVHNINKARNREFTTRQNVSSVNRVFYFPRYENNASYGKPRFIGSVRSELFANMHHSLVVAFEKRFPLKLGVASLYNRAKRIEKGDWSYLKNKNKEIGGKYESQKLNSLDDVVKIRTSNRTLVSEARLEQETSQDKIKKIKKDIDRINKDDDWIEEVAISRGLTKQEYDALIYLGDLNSQQESVIGEHNELQPRVKTLNQSDVSSMNQEIMMTSWDFKSTTLTKVHSPIDYFDFLCSDFDLEYRLGLSKFAECLGLSKSQGSRVLKKLQEEGFIEITRRFVYLCKYDGDEKKFKSVELKHGMLNDGNPRNGNKTAFSRIVKKFGCLLYEIESDKNQKIIFRVVKSTHFPDSKFFKKVFKEYFDPDDDLIKSKKYPKLEAKLL